MYPQKLENAKRIWFGNDYLASELYAHCYIHENYNYRMHSHQFYEINVIMRGFGRHYIADFNLPAAVGDVFVIPPEISHGYFTESGIDIAHILLTSRFTDRYREELLQMPGYDLFFNFEPMIRQNSGKNYNLNIPPEQMEKIGKELRKIAATENAGQYMYQNVLVLGLVSEISGMFVKSVEASSVEPELSREIFAVMQYIKENFDRKISVSEIAAYGNMSEATLNRRFKALLNMSPTDYLIDCRVKKAQELIKQNCHSKTEIAQLCGFYDLSHLNKYLTRAEKL